MKRLLLACSAILVVALIQQAAVADIKGALVTDRFGYTGSTTQYASLADAIAQVNPTSSITISNRDLSLFQISDLAAVYSDSNVISGAWWYTTAASGVPGTGNTRGNLGIGFLQLFEIPGDGFGSLTRTSVDFAFSGFNGTHYTTFDFSASGFNATPTTSTSRFSPFAINTNDQGTFQQYNLSLTATGLEGVKTGPNLIEAGNHPTGVTGNFSGIFQNTSADPAKQGFYRFSLDLDMINWAWDNRNDLTYPTTGFANSYFASTVPEPATTSIFALVAFGLAFGNGRHKRSRTA